MKNIFANHEIFDRWSDLTLVAWWGIFPPNNEKLLGRECVSGDEIKSINEKAIQKLLKGKKLNIEEFKTFVNHKYEIEEKRKEILESKAHSMLGESGIVVSLLLAAISFVVTQSTEISWQVIISMLLILLITLSFAIAGFHARNGVVLKKGYMQLDESDYLNDNASDKNLLLSKIYTNYYNSYLNDVKATYLKFAHWYYKAGLFLVTLTMIIVFILFACIPSVNNDKTNINDRIIYRNQIYKNTDSTIVK